MILVTCRTGGKYTEEMEDYIHDKFPHMEHIRYRGELVDLPGVWNKLALFKLPVTKPMLYIDLDTYIKDTNLPDLSTDKLMLLSSYWKRDNEKYYEKERRDTVLNSSVMYWETDQSYIFDKFMHKKDHYMKLYRGIDRFIFWEDIDYELLPDGICASNANPYIGYTNFITYNGEDYGQYFEGNK